MEMPDAHEEPIPQEPESPATVHLDTQAQAETSTTEPEDFATCWRTLFEDVFSATPMIYHSLKDKIPTLADGVIRIEVMNDFQKDQYEMRKRAVLEYWRNHFTINVDDIEIVTNEHLETKKMIYSSEDKMQNLAEQNSAFPDFLRELNFRIKD